jgi:dTDP-glucose 4,6-dehydratase
MSGKTYAILGGNGPFGVHTADYLLKHADPRRVLCIGRNPEKASPFTLDVGKGDDRYDYHQIHLVHELDRLFELFDREKPNVVINFAALAHGASWTNSWRFYETNVTSLAKMVEEIAKRDYLQRWIQVGSSELYGAVTEPATEQAPLNATSPYAVSKLAGDLHLVSMFKVKQFPMNIIRPSNAYGPGQQLYRVLPRAVVAGLSGQKLPLEGGGGAKKSYIHARDLARALYLIAEKAPLGRIYNAGPKDPVSIRELVEIAAEEMSIPFEVLVEVRPGRRGEDAQYWLDSSLIKRELGWEPEIGLREGIRDMVQWGRRYLDQLVDAPTDYVLRT